MKSVLLLIACIVILGINSVYADTGKKETILEAIYRGDLPAVKEQLKRDPRSLNRILSTGRIMTYPLHEALKTAHKEIALLLIERGADVNAKNDPGETPLQLAIFYSYKDILLHILDKGGDVNLQGSNGYSPLQVTCIGKEQMDFAGILLGRGAKLNIQDNMGMTALMSASSFGFKGMVKLLLEKGAKVSIKDSQGRNALDYAILKGDKEIVTMLKAQGAKPGNSTKTPIQK